MADKEREILWRERVAQWQKCGVSQNAFALQHGYRPGQLGYWIRRLRAQTPAPSLLPVEIKRATPAVSAMSTVSLRSPSGWSVMLPPELPISALTELLRGLP